MSIWSPKSSQGRVQLALAVVALTLTPQSVRASWFNPFHRIAPVKTLQARDAPPWGFYDPSLNGGSWLTVRPLLMLYLVSVTFLTKYYLAVMNSRCPIRTRRVWENLSTSSSLRGQTTTSCKTRNLTVDCGIISCRLGFLVNVWDRAWVPSRLPTLVMAMDYVRNEFKYIVRTVTDCFLHSK